MAKLRMAFTEGKTNKECSCFGGGLGGMEENKKSGGGDVRAKALAWDGEWDKA